MKVIAGPVYENNTNSITQKPHGPSRVTVCPSDKRQEIARKTRLSPIGENKNAQTQRLVHSTIFQNGQEKLRMADGTTFIF